MVEEITMSFTDYIYEPQCGETIAWKGQGLEKLAGRWTLMKETLYLYKQEYAMPESEVDMVCLPINPSIHLFAVTVE